MKTKKEILEKWEYSWKNGYALWSNQAGLNYKIIKENSKQKALEILKADYKKFKEMGIASFIQEAINDLNEMKVIN